MSAAWVKANPEKMRVHRRVWRVKNPKVVRKLAIEYEKRNPEKRRAHVAICNAVRRGTIIKPTICEDCGERLEPQFTCCWRCGRDRPP